MTRGTAPQAEAPDLSGGTHLAGSLGGFVHGTMMYGVDNFSSFMVCTTLSTGLKREGHMAWMAV